MRLTAIQVQAIREEFWISFFKEDKIWLFGSRVDDSKKGGDIDLYIETNYHDLLLVEQKKIQFISKLKKLLGDQKIDYEAKTILRADIAIRLHPTRHKASSPRFKAGQGYGF